MTEVAPHHRLAVLGGADCGRCPLHNQHLGPVPPTMPPAGRIPFLVVAEAPGPVEVDEGATLVGPSGREVRQALDQSGLHSESVAYTNAMLCKPPNINLEEYELECKKRGLPSPLECCRPRLANELARADFALFVGGASVRAAGIGESVMKLRGTPLRARPGLATLHPAFVLRDQGKLMRPVFRFDVAKAVRLARGGNTWADPPYSVVHDAETLFRVLLSMDDHVAVDTETEKGDREEGKGVDPWTARIRRVGITDGRTNVIYSPLSVHGHWMLDDETRAACWRVLAAFFQQPKHWYFHNFFAFDSIVLEMHGVKVNETQLFDSLIGHHVGPTSELPHGLDFLGSVYTDAPRWKDDVKHSTTRSDDILDKYLSFDTAVTRIAGPQVRASVQASDQESIYRLDAALGGVGREMARLGIRIDPGKRLVFAIEYEKKANRLLEEFLQAAGREVNPGSPKQLAKLLYNDFGLPVMPDHITDTGEPGTGKSALLELLALGVDARARKLIQALLGWRAADKILGTFVGRFENGQVVGGPPVHADGRLRTTWKVHGTTSGRWSSGDPVNLQNIPDKLRSMYVPEPGNVFVAADMSALEARILALLANDRSLIDAFTAFDNGTGPDIHIVNACTIFGCKPEQVTKEVRVFAKRFVYGLSYGAGPRKIFQTLSLLRDDDLNPVFPGLTLTEIERVYHTWWKAHPAIVAWRKALIAGWRKNGYIATPWHGRRRYFLGGENHEEMYNHPIQGGAADMQNSAVLECVQSYGFGPRRGLVLQVHDQLVVECPAAEAEIVSGHISRAMTKHIGPMRFPCEPKVGTDWKSVS